MHAYNIEIKSYLKRMAISDRELSTNYLSEIVMVIK